MLLAVRDGQENGQLTGMIKLAMKLERTFSSAELGPGESRQAEVNDGGVQAIKRVLEAETVLGRQVATAIE